MNMPVSSLVARSVALRRPVSQLHGDAPRASHNNQFANSVLVLGVNRIAAGVTISLGVLVAAVFSVFYAIGIPVVVRTLLEYGQLSVGEVWILLAILFCSNAGTYIFTSGIPSYMLRRRNIILQSLAHICSTTVASLVDILMFRREGAVEPFPLSLLENPLAAALYLLTPFIILVYMGVRSRSVGRRR